MDIYVVKPGDTIYSIAARYEVAVDKLIRDNELRNPDDLVTGQTIVIVYPVQTYIVKEGDTLGGIAEAFDVSVMQILRNNPFLSERKYIFPGETLTISYNIGRKISTNGFAFPFINKKILAKTLPSLTYLSIYNYKADAYGNITPFYDDTEIISVCKEYGVIPLMSITSLSAFGVMDLSSAYEILLNEQTQDKEIENGLNILKIKGYSGVNLVFDLMNSTTLQYYEKILSKVYKKLHPEGYYVLVTINPSTKNGEEEYEKIDYSVLSDISDRIIFIHFIWGTNTEAPAPVSSNKKMNDFLDYVTTIVPSAIINIGMPTIGYDWELPFVKNKTTAHSLSLDAVIDLAVMTDSVFKFDEASQTPFFNYQQFEFSFPAEHIVWFIDARSINSLMELVVKYGLAGTGVWNIMLYCAQLWLIINSQFEIDKL